MVIEECCKCHKFHSGVQCEQDRRTNFAGYYHDTEIADLRRQLKDEHNCQEKFAIRLLGQEDFDNSPCQAHPLELIEHHIENLRRQLTDVTAERDRLKKEVHRARTDSTYWSEFNTVANNRCVCEKCGQPHDPKLHSDGQAALRREE